ncbi:MAG TPA: glycosyltransferase family A protein [Gemmatimonadales bacterium]|nr:glycosyltransferase family A protein [Gemmatimonadales bacterium]
MNISVVIPCHNNGAHVAETLTSVRAQTRKPLEVIVVDDASTDDSAAVVAGFQEVRFLGLPRNSGVSLARNTGLFAARGEMVAWLDADDIWEPDHLATVAGLLENHPAVGVAFSLTQGFGMSEKVWEPLLPQLQPIDAFWPSWRQTVAQMSTCVMWRDRIVALHGFDPTIRAVEDFEFFLRLAREHPFVCTHAVTARYRKHSQSVSRQVVLARMQEYGVRKRFLTRSAKSETPEFVTRLEAEWRRSWETRLGEAWERRDLPLLRFYLGLQLLVPGSEAIGKRWRRRARLAPLWGPWDAISRRKRG